ncbi:ABC transporter permease [Aestuariivita boseongensis]|uniref:ABC transporter permease n=1 Tax=Aestuariivita boseongensis TaxID=1470562 RepID=UPI000683712D|nr:ABC transporter permease [Aestuariivita boseongensis]
MTGAGFSALWSHWRRNPLQLFTLVAGLALATALWSGVQAINAEARASYDAAAQTLGEGRFDHLLPRAGETVGQDRYVALRRSGWQVSPVLEGRVFLPDNSSVRVLGIDPLTTPGGLSPVRMEAVGGLAGFLTEASLFADAETAARVDGHLEGQVVVDPSAAPGVVITDIGTAQALLGQSGRISRMIVAELQPIGLPPLDRIAPDLIRRPAQEVSDVGRLTDSFHLNLTAFGFLSFAVGIFIVHGAIGLAFEQRRGMVRTLRALGMPLGRLVWLMVAELFVLALLAGALGVVLGYLIAGFLLPDVAATLRGLYGADVAGSVRLRPSWWASGFAIALIGTGVAAAGALWQIARMPLLASARPRAWVMARGQGAWRLGALAGLLLLAALGFALWGSGLAAGFALLACLLTGAALALPLILRAVLRLAEGRARSAVWQWFWADTRQQLPSLTLALMALLLAIAANVGVSTMVSSFRLTFVGFLDQRLAPELFITADTPEQAAALEGFLASRAREVLPVNSVETQVAGLPTELFGARVGLTYRENWQFLAQGPDPWDRVGAGQAVIINEQLARRAALWVGDRIAVGPDLSLPIAGIVADYGNPIGQAVVAEAVFARLFPDQAATRFGLRSDDPAALRRALIDDFGLPEGNIVDQAQIKAFSLEVFDRTFTVTAALNVLTLAVAGFAILMSLLTLAALRVPQLAPAWALGLTRAALGRLELRRAVSLAVLTTVLALPLGLALAWVLLAVVNVEAFGWELPMYLFPLDYARLALFALLAAVLAALWPAIRLARTPPGDLLKVFANER